MKAVIFAVVAVFTQTAFASSVQRLLAVTNDRGPETTVMSLKLSDTAQVESVLYTPQSGTREISLAQLARPEGVTLEEEQGVKAILLKGTVDNAAGTGRWTISYVANGLTKKYESCDITLRRSSQNTWALYNSSGAAVATAKVVTWSLGIRTITGLCD